MSFVLWQKRVGMRTQAMKGVAGEVKKVWGYNGERERGCSFCLGAKLVGWGWRKWIREGMMVTHD